jgi:hypothetical protein
MSSPLQSRPDYGEVNPFLNTPPTKLRRMIKKEKDGKRKRQMERALWAWRTSVPGPFRKTAAREIVRVAKILVGEG